MAMQIIHLNATSSTNEYLMNLASRQPQWEGCVMSDFQTSGKGMGTNTWESEAGKNLLFSILIHPRWMLISYQYLLSMAMALAIRDTLSEYTPDITIKWPNDIYWRDCKISGTRIDTNLAGLTITDMVIGTGININQRQFHSDAPNPVSLWQITGTEHSPQEILHNILAAFERYYNILRQGDKETVINRYHKHLYHRTGFHRYRDANGEFEAEIINVKPNGVLCLLKKDGTIGEYLFKEVETLRPETNYNNTNKLNKQN